MTAWSNTPEGTAVAIGRKHGDDWQTYVTSGRYLDHREASALAAAIFAAAGECWARNGREQLEKLESESNDE